tara:strand:+ start:55 stop:531 length:477 start_codon:yes stop_codon:yes gene_type:complete
MIANKRSLFIQALRRCAPLGLCLILALACTPRVEVHGFIPDDELVKQIKVGEHDRTGVARALGSPSSIATFNGETWYYISRRTETLAFLEPEIIDQRVLAVSFDITAGTVSAVDNYTLKDGRLIQLVQRQTPTRGKELGFIEQLFGNVGRFSGNSSGN